MSLFERIQNKRYDLQEGKKFGPGSDGRVNFNRDNNKKDKKEPLSDKEKLYRSKRDAKAKELGYKSGDELERTVDRGLKSIDKKPGGKLPKTGYATGEPFQPDNNPATVKYVKNKEGIPRKVPGTGKFPASGKSTLIGRFKYPSMDKDFSKAVKSGEVERDVAKRLKTRLSFTAKDELGDIRTTQGKKNIDNFTSKVFKNQKGTIGTGKGKNSDLYKILKRDIDNRNPTVPSSVINPKTGTRFRKPMPGGFDADGGRTGTKAQQNRYDMTAQKKAAKFDKEIVKQANLPKDLKIPKGGSGDSTPLSKKELNVKYKAAKLKLDYGGRMAKKDPKIAKMTAAQKKANIEKIKKDIYSKPSSQPSKAPLKFSTYKYDRKNIVPTGLKGKDQPKFKDIKNTISYKSTTKDRLNLNKRDLAKFSKKTKFAPLKKASQAVKYKTTFGDFAKRTGKKGLKFIGTKARNNKLATAAIAIGAGAFAYDRIKKAIAGPTLKDKDFTATKPIQDRSGKNVKFTYGKDAKDKAMPYLTKDKTIKTPKGTKTVPGSLTKFKTGDYKVATKSGANYNVNDRIKNSAFEKQLQKAEKNPNKNKNKDFLKKFKNATRPT